MNTNRVCGCKGVRSCLQCEQEFQIERLQFEDELRQTQKSWSFCMQCNCFRPGWNTVEVNQSHHEHEAMESEYELRIPGLHITEHFLSPEECKELTNNLDNRVSWCVSQSGRRKQNFGPKTNFKKRKLRVGSFRGFPDFSEYLQIRFRSQISILKDFRTIEQCSLEYDPVKGASIDPHIDDCWIWGERVVTVNCLGDATLTLTPFQPSLSDRNDYLASSKYNLNCIPKYKSRLIEPLWSTERMLKLTDKILRIPMPSGSLMVLYGPLRYQFEHCVLRSDVKSRRVCIAYREFTPPYLEGGDYAQEGLAVLKVAKNFWCSNG